MTDLELHLRLAGLPLVLIGLGHAFLPRVLAWATDLASVSALNRQIAYVHSGYIGLTCVLMGLLPLTMPGSLLNGGPLATAVLVGYLLFWGSRLFVQVLVYDAAHWRGNAVRTLIHAGFVALWSYETAVYALALAAVWTGRGG